MTTAQSQRILSNVDYDVVLVIKLTFTTLWANWVEDKLVIVFRSFSQKAGYDISCELSLLEKLCTDCQILLSGKNKKKTFQDVVLWKFYPEC